jgi:hypothetical protein
MLTEICCTNVIYAKCTVTLQTKRQNSRVSLKSVAYREMDKHNIKFTVTILYLIQNGRVKILNSQRNVHILITYYSSEIMTNK